MLDPSPRNAITALKNAVPKWPKGNTWRRTPLLKGPSGEKYVRKAYVLLGWRNHNLGLGNGENLSDMHPTCLESVCLFGS